MKTKSATVVRIRPISWKVCVVGDDCANYVRTKLHEAGMDCSQPIQEPDLQESPIYSFIASPTGQATLTAPELQSILDQDDRIEVAFEG